MDTRQELQVQKKREHDQKQETTIPARVFVPTADIYESQDALTVILEMPGVQKDNVEVRVEEGTLHIEGRLDLAKYKASCRRRNGSSRRATKSGISAKPSRSASGRGRSR